jgi:hypothetical protein
MGVKFTSRINQWSKRKAQDLDAAMFELATTIHRDAGNLAPVDTAALVKSGKVKRNGEGNYSIIFGGGAVRYAKMRHYQNKKNPQTLLYLKRAGDSNSKNFKRYIKGL